MPSDSSKRWNLIIITAGNEAWRAALQQECSALHRGGLLPDHEELLVIADPSSGNGSKAATAGVGSGEATINAILLAAETLSALKGRSMINSDDLKGSCILLVHVGRPSGQQWLLHPSAEGIIYGGNHNASKVPVKPAATASRGITAGADGVKASGCRGVDGCTKALEDVDCSSSADVLSRSVPAAIRRKLPWPAPPLLTALWNASSLAPAFEDGVWVSSVECSLLFPPGDVIQPVPASTLQLEASLGAFVCTVTVPAKEAVRHGLVLADERGVVQRIIYRPSLEQCDRIAVEGAVPILSGQLYLSPALCDRLLSLHTLPPFTHCTYHATDSGLQPFSVSLYFELISALCSGISRDDFVRGCDATSSSRVGDGDDSNSDNSSKYASVHYRELSHQNRQLRTLARECAWKLLSSFKLVSHNLTGVGFHHTSSHRALVDEPLYKELELRQGALDGGKQQHLVNSTIHGQVATSLTSFKLKGKPICLSDVYLGQGCSLNLGGGSVLIGLELSESVGRLDLDLGGGLVWQQCQVVDVNSERLDHRRDGESVVEGDRRAGTCESTQRHVITCHGITDNMSLEYPKGGMFNRSWEEVIRWMGKTVDDIWQGGFPRTPLNARVFTTDLNVPEQIQRLLGLRSNIFRSSGVREVQDLTYLSLAEINMLYSPLDFLEYRHRLLGEYVLKELGQTPSASKCVDVKKTLDYLSYANKETLEDIFVRLHDLAGKDNDDQGESWAGKAETASTRLLAVAADVLSALAGWQGNIRTGPAANSLFNDAFQQLKVGSLQRGVASLYLACQELCNKASFDGSSFSSPATVTRAARHYQRAVHLLIARQILQSVQPLTATLCPSPLYGAPPPAAGVWVEGRCPGRLDLAGGWTDTPPICYELGGAVLNVAIKVNGEFPITIRGRWNESSRCGGPCERGTTPSTYSTDGNVNNEFIGAACVGVERPDSGSARYHSGVTCLLRSAGSRVIKRTVRETLLDHETRQQSKILRTEAEFRQEASREKSEVPRGSASSDSVRVSVDKDEGECSGRRSDESEDQVLQLHWTSLKQFEDYNNPLSPGALIKAALVYCGIVDLSSDEDLDQQLQKYGGGWLELEIISKLPPGSGLGGSSLVAGALLAVLAVLTCKRDISTSALIHATLGLEQCMTTAGGWQDQVGGLFGGVKLGVSYRKLPVRVDAFGLSLSPEMLWQFNQRLLLLYTGQVRLAKNLLQSVVRSWYSGDARLHSTFRELIGCALAAARAVANQDLEDLSQCVATYWSLKKTVAPGSEPQKVTELLAALDPCISGASLAGAGGGGYLYAFLKPEACQGLDTASNEGLVCAAQSVDKSVSLHVLENALLGSGLVRDVAEVATTGLVVTIGGEHVVLQIEQPDQMLDQDHLMEISKRLLAE